MIKVLVSSCLMGKKVRYDGSDNDVGDLQLKDWDEEGRLVHFCPEVAGGLGTPRSPAEITKGGGDRVLTRMTRVMNNEGVDVSEAFIHGAEQALQCAQKHQIRIAILKESSPSCGSSFIYDGSFSGLKLRGQGVAATLLGQNGIHVFNENDIPAALQYLTMLEKIALKRSN